MAGGAAAQTVWARPLSSFLLTALPFIRIQMREPMHRSISSEGARWRADIVGGGGEEGRGGRGNAVRKKNLRRASHLSLSVTLRFPDSRASQAPRSPMSRSLLLVAGVVALSAQAATAQVREGGWGGRRRAASENKKPLPACRARLPLSRAPLSLSFSRTLHPAPHPLPVG